MRTTITPDYIINMRPCPEWTPERIRGFFERRGVEKLTPRELSLLQSVSLEDRLWVLLDGDVLSRKEQFRFLLRFLAYRLERLTVLTCNPLREEPYAQYMEILPRIQRIEDRLEVGGDEYLTLLDDLRDHFSHVLLWSIVRDYHGNNAYGRYGTFQLYRSICSTFPAMNVTAQAMQVLRELL